MFSDTLCWFCCNLWLNSPETVFFFFREKNPQINPYKHFCHVYQHFSDKNSYRNERKKKKFFLKKHMCPIEGWGKLMEAQLTSLVSVNSHWQHFNTISKKKEPTVATHCAHLRFVTNHLLRQTSVNTFVYFFSKTYGAVCSFPSAQLWLCGMWTEWSYSFLGIMWSLGKQNRT